ncbi:MAG: acetyltransferase [Alphaproteobacteria bacterium]|nr:acetyltransferase [Alphaproteobacteria bacterium]
MALIGASRQANSVGAVLAKNLNNAGFKGPVWLVNARAPEIGPTRYYGTIQSLPATPDLAVIATPPQTVPDMIRALAARGTKAAVVITAGFSESRDAAGRKRMQAMLDAAKPTRMRIVGPNCLGIQVPAAGLNASFAHVQALPGSLAFVAQSGAIITAVLDWAAERRIGFSHVASLGDMSDVDFGDMLDWLALDGGTTAILLYVESVSNARKFMSAARAAARTKPVIVVKAGRSAAASRAALSHTGAMAGSDAVYDAAFRRAGMLRVDDIDELFEAVATLGTGHRILGERLVILSNGGGFGVLATDALLGLGGTLAALEAGTLERLDGALPSSWPRTNPIDIIGDAPPERYGAALDALLGDRSIDAVLAINAPTAVASSEEAARVVAERAAKAPWPVLTSWVGAQAAAPARQVFIAAGLPTFETPRQAVHGFLHLVNYQRNREALMETPVSAPEEIRIDVERARRAMAPALEKGGGMLSEPQAKTVLEACGIPVNRTLIARDATEASAAARTIGSSIALKIMSPDITHKSDVGGVILNLAPEEVGAAAAAMQERVKARQPQARIAGFSVQAMVRREGAHELILGMSVDATFGPVLLFGHGGIAVERINDAAMGLPPLNMALAHDMMRRTRIYRLLEGYRDRKRAAMDTIALTLMKLSQATIELPEIVEIDINPLLADENGVVALDARLRVAPTREAGEARLAIRPYPRHLEHKARLRDGRELLLRPVRPEDEPLIHGYFARMDKEDVRMRFFAPMSRLPHNLAARLTQIDYDRQMAFLAFTTDAEGKQDGLGVVRIAADPDNRRAEYAITVRSDVKGAGVGRVLMRSIVDYARQRGIGEIFGTVLRENERMLRVCRAMGFTLQVVPEDPTIVEVVMALR